MLKRHSCTFRLLKINLVFAAMLLAACQSSPSKPAPQEKFGSAQTHSRPFEATPAQTCEAARRALMSQGYVINTARADLIEGRKNFQPEAESHLQMEIRVVCAPEGTAGKETSIGFVTALQDRYSLKKSASSASVGVGLLGSVSLPFTSGNDAMIKVASETVSSPAFYESFFDLVKRYLVIGPSEPAAKAP